MAVPGNWTYECLVAILSEDYLVFIMKSELDYKYLGIFLCKHSLILFEMYRIRTQTGLPPIMTHIPDEFPAAAVIKPQRSHLKLLSTSIYNHFLTSEIIHL
jgi:hypothetical protein